MRKKKQMKKIMAFILTLVLCLGMSNLSVFATEEPTNNNTDTNEIVSEDGSTGNDTGSASVEGTGAGTSENAGSNTDEGAGTSGENDDDNSIETVTLTYDANAGGDKVTGLPANETVEKGKQVVIKNYRSMTREGYTIYGWSTNPNAVFPDTTLRIGDKYTLDEDTTFYAVWIKDKEPDPEVPEGAMLQSIKINPSFYVERDGKFSAMQEIPIVQYDYSYEYNGTTYTGTTTAEELPFGGASNNQVLKVLVANDGAPTKVTLTMKGYEVKGYKLFQQQLNHTASGWESVSQTAEATMSVTNTSFSSVYNYSYYRVDTDIPEDKTVTNREVDIMVSFVDAAHNPFRREQVSDNYEVTYSYVNAEGETVTNVLKRENAESVNIPRKELERDENGLGQIVGEDENVIYEFLKWKVTVPVTGEGIYLDITQSDYQINANPYVWNNVFGVQSTGTNGSDLGKLYVSKDNNPVTTYIYNVYAKQYTVTYNDGVDGSDLFPDQSYKAAEGSATPAFNGTPTRGGYTFTGWSPAVAATVTGDVTYTAQWSLNYSPGIPTTPVNPQPPTTDIPEEDPPLVDVPDTGDTEIDEPDVPLAQPDAEPEDVTDISEENVPLSDAPKTGDNSGIQGWVILMFLSGAGLVGLTLENRKRKNTAK